jgi:hypothetical protein
MPPRRIGSRVAVAAAAVLALAGIAACGSRSHKPKIVTTVAAGLAPVPPAQDGAYFGASDDHQLNVLEGVLGRKVDIAAVAQPWDQPFPRPDAAAALAGDRYLMLSLTDGKAKFDDRGLVSGRYDQVVRQRALEIKAAHKPVFLRWQWDMDLTRTATAVDHIAAWKHLRQIFHGMGADNVTWVWCPTAAGFSGSADEYYPGDDQVDWICADAYLPAKGGYTNLSEVLKPFLDWAAQHPKPIMIGQFGVPQAYGTRRAEWLRKAALALQRAQIKAVVYSDVAKESVDHDAAAGSALREMATSPFFNPRNLPVQSG